MPRFTKQQDQLIVELYPRAPQQQIIEALGNQKWRSILERAKKLGISRDLSFIHSQFRTNDNNWTQQEDSILKQYYQLGDKQSLVRLLPNRSWSSQKSRAQALQLIFNQINQKSITLNQRFNFWKVIEIQQNKFKCICLGCSLTIKQLDKYDLIYSKTKSCGCQSKQIREQTNLKKFGSAYYTQTEQFQGKRKQTCLKKYQRSTNLDIPEQRKKNTKKTLESKIKKGLIKQLDNSTTLAEYCKQVGANYSHALSLYKDLGKQQAFEYLKNYTGKHVYGTTEQRFINLLEQYFPNLTCYNQTPKEFQINNKPDFRLQHNNKVLYINIDGLFWHSEIRKTNNNYHKNLREQFNKNNCTIFQFRENEIREKGEIVKSIILNYLGYHQNRIYARECTIASVEASEAQQFFNNNHLMGYVAAPTYGLYYKNKLVMAISIKTKNDGIDVARLCSSLNTTIVGGLSKLLTFIIKKYNPKFIQSFVDLRYATGSSYKTLQFTLEKVTLGFNWTDFKDTFNRRRCRANMDQRRLTERQQADLYKWTKIYDAGQAKYIKILHQTINHSE